MLWDKTQGVSARVCFCEIDKTYHGKKSILFLLFDFSSHIFGKNI